MDDEQSWVGACGGNSFVEPYWVSAVNKDTGPLILQTLRFIERDRNKQGNTEIIKMVSAHGKPYEDIPRYAEKASPRK